MPGEEKKLPRTHESASLTDLAPDVAKEGGSAVDAAEENVGFEIEGFSDADKGPLPDAVLSSLTLGLLGGKGKGGGKAR